MFLNDVIEVCTKCSIHKSNKVVGEGNTKNPIAMLIGEAPGAEEDKLGLPFVGDAGKILRRLISECGINQNDIYITNVLKCRPKQNATPTNEQMINCANYLNAQIVILKPKIILTLGSIALNFFTNITASISKCRGQVFQVASPIPVYLMATWHPAFYFYKETKHEQTEVINQLRVDLLLLNNLINNLKR